MGIELTHPDYEDYKKAAEYCEWFMEGEWEVKSKGEKLLPRLSGQDNCKYEAYKQRAIVYGVVPRTVSALVATAFRKEPSFILPEKLQYLLEDCTGTGVPLLSYTMRLLSEILVTGRAGSLVDMPEEGGNPVFVLYDGDDIRNYSMESGEEFVVLENSTLVRDPDDKFKLVEKEGYRELALENGQYVVRVWEQDEEGEPQVVKTIVPVRFGRPLSFIPFAPVTSFGVEYEVSLPPILPLAQLAHKAYMISADRQLAIHVIAIPTPVVSADIDKGEFGVLNLGPDTCLLLPANGKASFLEFTGQGLSAIEKAEKDIQDMMAALGARLLMGQNASSEKAAGVRSRDEVANSVLISALTALEAAMNRILKWAAEWVGADPDEAYCKISKELTATTVDANTVNALVAAYQKNSIDLDTLFFNLAEGGYISAETDKETFAKNLESQASKETPVPVQGVDNTQIV